jgi:hypothetical protein
VLQDVDVHVIGMRRIGTWREYRFHRRPNEHCL